MRISIEMESDKLMKKLDELSGRGAKTAARAAVRETTVYMQKQLARQASMTYMKERTDFANATKIRKPTFSNLTGDVIMRGRKLSPLDYKAKPSTMSEQRALKSKTGVEVQILRKGDMKPLGKAGRRAFLAEFLAKHIDKTIGKTAAATPKHLAVVRRLTRERFPLKEFWAPALPQAAGSRQVMDVVRPEGEKKLAEALEKHIDKYLSK